MQIYGGWNKLPRGLKTRGQWELLNRKVRKDEVPKALLAYSEIRRTGSTTTIHDDGTEEHREPQAKVVLDGVGVFAEEQTKPFKPSNLVLAYRAFYDYFVGHTSKSHYIWITSEDWLWCYGGLGRQRTKSHVDGLEEYGVIGGGGTLRETTRFGLIDHDLHDGDLDIFLEQQRILIDEFHGKDGWHVQVKNENAGGVHLIQVVPEMDVADYRRKLLRKLQDLDLRNPGLEARARSVGMKSFSQLEIYPDRTHGIRLPLAKGRTVLLDRPLPLRTNIKGRQVQDVVGYIRWINDAERAYMPTDEVFEYVRLRMKPSVRQLPPSLPDSQGTHQSEVAVAVTSGRSLNQFRQQHRTWPQFVEWLAKHGLPGQDCFGEVIYELSKWLVHVELSHLDDAGRIDRAIALLNVYAQEKNNGYITRLDQGKDSAVTGQISRIVRRAMSIAEEYRDKLVAIRILQDSGKYLRTIQVEPIICGTSTADMTADSCNTSPPSLGSTYLSLHVLKEKGILDKELPSEVSMTIAETRGRQKIDLLARRLLNAIYFSPGHRRLISYSDIFQMMDEDFRRDVSEKPTTASLYLKTLQKKARLIAVGRTYRRGESATEYVLTDQVIEWYRGERPSI